MFKDFIEKQKSPITKKMYGVALSLWARSRGAKEPDELIAKMRDGSVNAGAVLPDFLNYLFENGRAVETAYSYTSALRRYLVNEGFHPSPDPAEMRDLWKYHRQRLAEKAGRGVPVRATTTNVEWGKPAQLVSYETDLGTTDETDYLGATDKRTQVLLELVRAQDELLRSIASSITSSRERLRIIRQALASSSIKFVDGRGSAQPSTSLSERQNSK